MFKIYKPTRSTLYCYFIGFCIIAAVIILDTFYPTKIELWLYQSLLLAGAIIVCIGSIINTLSHIKSIHSSAPSDEKNKRWR